MTAPEHDSVAYKILTREQRDSLFADGRFSGAPIDLTDGYIHMSTADQVQGTLDKHFDGQDDLHIAAVDLSALGDAVKWEASRGNALFPHIYAALPLSAVIAHGPVHRDATGTVQLPRA
tara:strand:- start:296 stop:652 length:357 start_codon:yes stop_codon:yes gene_type:complete